MDRCIEVVSLAVPLIDVSLLFSNMRIPASFMRFCLPPSLDSFGNAFGTYMFGEGARGILLMSVLIPWILECKFFQS
jgi:hypothetical protein